MRLASALLLTLSLAACKRDPLDDPRVVEDLATKLLAEARSPDGIGTDLVDDVLVEKVRRIQLVRRFSMDTLDRDKLLDILGGNAGPDRQYPPAERPQKQRERATRGLRAQAQGACKAVFDAAAAGRRIRFLTDPIKGAPVEVGEAQDEMKKVLEGAEVARLDCANGVHIGVLAARAGGQLKVVDLYPIDAPGFEFNPNDPAMK